MNTLFAEANIVVQRTQLETQGNGFNVRRLAFLNELDVGECDGIPSEEQHNFQDIGVMHLLRMLSYLFAIPSLALLLVALLDLMDVVLIFRGLQWW